MDPVVNVGYASPIDTHRWSFVNMSGDPYSHASTEQVDYTRKFVIPYLEGRTKRLATKTSFIPADANAIISFMSREYEYCGDLSTELLPSGSSILFYGHEIVGFNEGLGQIRIRKSRSDSNWNYIMNKMPISGKLNARRLSECWNKILRILCTGVEIFIMDDEFQSRLKLELKFRGAS